jgi:hypothetical protein
VRFPSLRFREPIVLHKGAFLGNPQDRPSSRAAQLENCRLQRDRGCSRLTRCAKPLPWWPQCAQQVRIVGRTHRSRGSLLRGGGCVVPSGTRGVNELCRNRPSEVMSKPHQLRTKTSSSKAKARVSSLPGGFVERRRTSLRERIFPRLKRRLNRNFGQGAISATLEIDDI